MKEKKQRGFTNRFYSLIRKEFADLEAKNMYLRKYIIKELSKKHLRSERTINNILQGKD